MARLLNVQGHTLHVCCAQVALTQLANHELHSHTPPRSYALMSGQIGHIFIFCSTCRPSANSIQPHSAGCGGWSDTRFTARVYAIMRRAAAYSHHFKNSAFKRDTIQHFLLFAFIVSPDGISDQPKQVTASQV